MWHYFSFCLLYAGWNPTGEGYGTRGVRETQQIIRILSDHLLWSSSHIWVRRFRCSDSQRDYYAHDVQHSDARGGGGRGRGWAGWDGEEIGEKSQGPNYSNRPLQRWGAAEP